jgi:hypothetical protein
MVVSKSVDEMVRLPSLISNKKLFNIGIIGFATITPSIIDKCFKSVLLFTINFILFVKVQK